MQNNALNLWRGSRYIRSLCAYPNRSLSRTANEQPPSCRRSFGCRARVNAGGRMNTHVLSSPEHSVGPFDVSIRGGAPQLQNNLGSSLVHNLLESHASVSPSHKASLRRCRTLRRCSQLHDASWRVLLDDTRKVTLPRGVKDDAVCATFTATETGLRGRPQKSVQISSALY